MDQLLQTALKSTWFRSCGSNDETCHNIGRDFLSIEKLTFCIAQRRLPFDLVLSLLPIRSRKVPILSDDGSHIPGRMMLWTMAWGQQN